MIVHPRPTRAETSDVANAIYDGTSAIMLSAETSVGKYPVEAVATMAKIAVRTESDIDYERNFKANMYRHETSITNAIAHATVTTAHDLEAAAILCVSKSGYTAHHVSKFRPSCPVIVGTPDPTVQHQMKMAWGVLPILTKTETTEPDLFNGALQTATKEGHLNEGDLVIITAGVPVGQSGTTNMLKVHVLGEKMEVF
jgi:pyruvate kinase